MGSTPKQVEPATSLEVTKESLKTLLRHGIVTLGAIVVLRSHIAIPPEVIAELADKVSTVGVEVIFSFLSLGGLGWSWWRGVRLQKLEKTVAVHNIK